MKRKLMAMLAGGWLCSFASAQPAWLSDGDTTIEQARKAKREDVSPAVATTEMMALGRDPAQVVQSVVRVYSDCDALRSSVETGSRLRPADAQAIVEAVNALPCQCTGDTLWPHIRLESRIRPESTRLAVSIPPGSICGAAAAEAAARGAPQSVSDILRGAIGSARRGGAVLDSVGQVGSEPEQMLTQQNLQRDSEKDDGCTADLAVDDEFRPEERFAEKPVAAEVLAASRRCEDAMDLMIDGVATAVSDNTAVVMRNDTDQLLDLTSGGYALEVYFAGSTVPGRKVALEGTVNPGESFVVASPDADPTVRRMANLITPSVRVSPGDSVVLRRGSAITDCRTVATAMAVIANSLGREAGAAWAEQLEREFEVANALRTVDAIGQAGSGPEAWQGAMAGQPMTLKRENDLCESDIEPADAFEVAGGWSGAAGVDPAELGNGARRCAARSADLVISQYANNAEEYRAVEILNNTSGDIDLGSGGYVLEVFADGAREPTRTVALEGKVKLGETFVIADSDAPSAVRERSQMVTGELSQEKINALVLRRVNVAGGKACAAEVIATVRDLGELPLTIALANPLVPSRTPNNDEVIDGDPSGLASPN